MGGFFNRFSTFLQTQDIKVSKINFNAGDAFFYHHPNTYEYTDTLAQFSAWLQAFIEKHDIDAVVCFGDCRPHHTQAGCVSEQLGISFFVFEEGYLRPDYITLQEYGINGYSRLNTADIKALKKANDHPLYTHNRFYRLSIAAIVYYIVAWIYKSRYPHYSHYRGMTAWQEAIAWLKAPWRKLRGYFPDKKLQSMLTTQESDNYFLISLQVHNDSQITHHSDYRDVVQFIDESIASFAKHADQQQLLVFKHHPLDRGHRDYRELVSSLSERYQVANRVFYGCDMHLPTLMKHSIGMVTINSTTGLQSVYHKKPTKVMGRAIYDTPKLIDQKALKDFWKRPESPDNEFYLRFREYLIEQTQLNGAFYGRSPWMYKYLQQAENNAIELSETKTPH
ncbi:Capsular polysaccharide export system protein KpsS [Psychrobacter alimentarius]|uniref:Capsular polysaccharide export system protein KpsS n=2 Tax=Moraxellaceae TaxID=468 RepID=A0ABM5ZVH5_9GAMM|nr:Capsular polysaccharide export system protein KpsS [Psychrobacter alimentarius]QCB32125.1 capsular biosynthesis protein [Psychrobacter sp. PAMC27889]